MSLNDPVVLVADDSEADLILMRTAFKRAGFIQPLQTTKDGDEAMAYLRGEGAYRNRKQFPIPTVLLLDLKMLRTGGFEVLEWIQGNPEIKRLPVYILSTSNRPEDIERAYDLGAHAYLVKPSTLDALTQMARQLLEWIKINEFTP